jgi:hypothetical protein
MPAEQTGGDAGDDEGGLAIQDFIGKLLFLIITVGSIPPSALLAAPVLVELLRPGIDIPAAGSAA